MAEQQEFSKYERARILGARGLQISMDAPLLIKIKDDALENLNYDPLRIAEIELDSGVLPISIKRPLPEKKEEELEKIKIDEKGVSDEAKEKAEQEAVKEIAEQGEIMKLANPEDEESEEESSSSSGDEALQELS